MFPGETGELKRSIADAGGDRGFILQGGDCFERFDDCPAESITNKIKILLQMSVVLTYAARRPVGKTRAPVVWSCDPVHGNTRATKSGVKTRSYNDTLAELSDTFSIHAREGGRLSGVHFELTGENVTECTEG